MAKGVVSTTICSWWRATYATWMNRISTSSAQTWASVHGLRFFSRLGMATNEHSKSKALAIWNPTNPSEIHSFETYVSKFLRLWQVCRIFLLRVKSPKLPQPRAYRNYWHPNIPLCQRRCQLAWTDQNAHLTWQSLNRNLGQACRYVHPPAFFFLCRLPYSSHCKSSLHWQPKQLKMKMQIQETQMKPKRNNWKVGMRIECTLNAYLEAQLNLTWRSRWRRVRAQHRGTSEVVDRTR